MNGMVRPDFSVRGGLGANVYIEVLRTLVLSALLWLVSTQAYYAIVSGLDLKAGYDSAPILFAAYYLGWAMLAVWVFRDLIGAGLDRSTFRRKALLLLPILAGIAFFVVYVLPLLPRVSEARAPADPPEFMFASA
jgi:hypothetical protein